MKIRSYGLVFFLLVSVLPSWAAGVPESFNYQGVLRDGAGLALTNNLTPTIYFKLYSAATGGSALWTNSTTVLLDSNGLFNVTLSDEDGLLTGVIASNAGIFLGLTVQGSTEISPRQQLLSVPFALKAGDVDQASGDFTVNGSLTVTDGAEIQGALQATSVQIGDSTLTTNIYGNGNLTLSGNLDVQDELTVAGNTTLSNLSAPAGVCIATNFYAVAGEESLRIVRGSIYCTDLNNPDPAQSHGSGWGVGNPQIGKYIVTFNRPFSDTPTVIASPWSSILGHSTVITALNPTNFSVSTYDSGDNLGKFSFHFIAVGPR